VESRDIGPKSDTSALDGGEEGSGIFGVAGRDAAPSFQVEKSSFDPMPEFVEVFIIRPLKSSLAHEA